MTTTTTIDWLRFRTKASPVEALGALQSLFGGWGATLTLGAPQRGILGFRQACPIRMGDVPLGRIDFGGDSQRGWSRVDMPGAACGFVKDWDAIEEVEALPSVELRRLDIALTTWEGQIGHDQVLSAHAAGLFTTRGRPPVMRQILSSSDHDGRTVYIGTREKADKFLRCYEKGKELAAKLGPSSLGTRVTHIDGYRVEDIYRVELELKAENSVIPWETIERRDQYFAGSYPFCAKVLPGIEPDILQRRPDRAPQRELRAALANCRHQYGAALFTALHAYGGDIGAVWEKVVGTEHNRHLLEAGVLLVDHD